MTTETRPNYRPINAMVSEEQIRLLEGEARREQTSISDIVRRALRKYFSQAEGGPVADGAGRDDIC